MAAKVTHPRELAEVLATWGNATDRAEALYEDAEMLRRDIEDAEEVAAKCASNLAQFRARLATASIRLDAANAELGSYFERAEATAIRHGYKSAQDAENAANGITPFIIGG